jgi:hypothetical protein
LWSNPVRTLESAATAFEAFGQPPVGIDGPECGVPRKKLERCAHYRVTRPPRSWDTEHPRTGPHDLVDRLQRFIPRTATVPESCVVPPDRSGAREGMQIRGGTLRSGLGRRAGPFRMTRVASSRRTVGVKCERDGPGCRYASFNSSAATSWSPAQDSTIR